MDFQWTNSKSTASPLEMTIKHQRNSSGHEGMSALESMAIMCGDLCGDLYGRKRDIRHVM